MPVQPLVAKTVAHLNRVQGMTPVHVKAPAAQTAPAHPQIAVALKTIVLQDVETKPVVLVTQRNVRATTVNQGVQVMAPALVYPTVTQAVAIQPPAPASRVVLRATLSLAGVMPVVLILATQIPAHLQPALVMTLAHVMAQALAIQTVQSMTHVLVTPARCPVALDTMNVIA